MVNKNQTEGFFFFSPCVVVVVLFCDSCCFAENILEGSEDAEAKCICYMETVGFTLLSVGQYPHLEEENVSVMLTHVSEG